jgi:putative ABC transport system substrate-binding protein
MDPRRRRLSCLLAASAAALGAYTRGALAASRVFTVGYLSAGSRGEELVQALGALGYFAGRNLRFELRLAPYGSADLDRRARELVELPADALVAYSVERLLALRRATTSLPIVAGRIANPVGLGLARSLSRPGLNVTGLSWDFEPTMRMLCEMVRQVVPGLSRLVMLHPPRHGGGDGTPSFEAGARAARVALEVRMVSDARDGEREVDRLDPARDALALAPNFEQPTLEAIARRARAARLATTGTHPLIPESGGLLSFSESYADANGRIATLLDKVLRGAHPGDLPFELPDRADFVVNLATARALGIAFPGATLLRATRIID